MLKPPTFFYSFILLFVNNLLLAKCALELQPLCNVSPPPVQLLSIVVSTSWSLHIGAGKENAPGVINKGVLPRSSGCSGRQARQF